MFTEKFGLSSRFSKFYIFVISAPAPPATLPLAPSLVCILFGNVTRVAWNSVTSDFPSRTPPVTIRGRVRVGALEGLFPFAPGNIRLPVMFPPRIFHGSQEFHLSGAVSPPLPVIFPPRIFHGSLRGIDTEMSDFSSHQNVTFLYSNERDLFP